VVVAAEPLAGLLAELRRRDYQFTAVTPATHARVLARPVRHRPTLRDVFGWNRPFAHDDLDPNMFELLDAAQAVKGAGANLRSKVRVASLGTDLFVHTGFPTQAPDSVFFGPDTYRFARFVAAQLGRIGPVGHLVDMGAGSGAGAISAARAQQVGSITMVDVNRAALALARANLLAASLAAELICADRLPAGHDVVIANPPYIVDPDGRTYRDGGGLLGGAVALAWVEQFLDGGRGTMLLYTGAAVAAGRSPLLDAIGETCRLAGASVAVEEIDVDVFGEELELAHYDCVERIAAVGLVIEQRA